MKTSSILLIIGICILTCGLGIFIFLNWDWKPVQKVKVDRPDMDDILDASAEIDKKAKERKRKTINIKWEEVPPLDNII